MPQDEVEKIEKEFALKIAQAAPFTITSQYKDGDWPFLEDWLKSALTKIYAQGYEDAVGKVMKSKEENAGKICKSKNCADPLCGHAKCIDWMYYDLLAALRSEVTKKG